MDFKFVLIIIILILFLYFVLNYIYSTNTVSTSITSGTTMQTIDATKLSSTKSGIKSSNFTYSIWFYIDDWNYNYGKEKVLFGRVGSPTSSPGASGSYGKEPCPMVTFGGIENNLNVMMNVYSGSGTSSSITHTCNVSNIPIQAWCNLLISVYGRTLDIYLDGKLVNTCVLPGTAKINENANVYITPVGGFSGWTSKFEYYPNATDPQTAWNIYQNGYSNSIIDSVFGTSFRVKFSTVDSSGTETSSYTI
jgi:hypothetical protein